MVAMGGRLSLSSGTKVVLNRSAFLKSESYFFSKQIRARGGEQNVFTVFALPQKFILPELQIQTEQKIVRAVLSKKWNGL